MAQKTSAAGRAAIARHEALRLNAYPDPATGGEPWTIGYGHTSAAGPPKVSKGMKITASEADAILSRDLSSFEKAVNGAVKVPLNQNEFDALASFAFNVGGGNFKKSSVLRKLNAGDRKGAADALLLWNKADGKVMKGLTKRRQEERALFLKPVTSGAQPKPAAKPAPSPATDPKQAILKQGATGQYVEDLQTNLTVLGYPVKVDGKFGTSTKVAVEAFQRDHKDADGTPLKVDGVAGTRTTTAIGAALTDRETKPKVEAARKDVETEVKSKTNWLTGLLGTGGVLSGAWAWLREADWQTLALVGGVTVGGIVVVLIGGRMLVRRAKDIIAEIKA